MKQVVQERKDPAQESGADAAKETAQDRAWKNTNRDNTVNTSPEAERGAKKFGLNSLDFPLQNCSRENPTPSLWVPLLL